MPVVGLDSTLRNLRTLSVRLPADADTFLLREAQSILDRSLQLVPHDQGDLARSGEVKRTGGNVSAGIERTLFARDIMGRFTRGSYSVAYGKTPESSHALAVHEHPSQHDPPSWEGREVNFHSGGPKFLERAFRESHSNFNERLAAFLRSKLGVSR